ncbi:uncharacterized protein ACMZJ9_004520 [Mantella aurantiaca]
MVRLPASHQQPVCCDGVAACLSPTTRLLRWCGCLPLINNPSAEMVRLPASHQQPLCCDGVAARLSPTTPLLRWCGCLPLINNPSAAMVWLPASHQQPVCCDAGLHGTSGERCVDQPVRAESSEGKSVAVPCQFTFPQSQNNYVSVNFIVKAADGNFCGRENDVIYQSNTSMFSDKYRERLSVTFDLRRRNASITIKNVTKADATKYCCRIVLGFLNGGIVQWQTPDGTNLTVRDRTDPALETIPVIFAAPGEKVTLLAHFTSNSFTSSSNITCLVGRITNAKCDHSRNFTNCTYENNSLSVQIDHVTTSDEDSYCWKVDISTEDQEIKTYDYLGPQLLVVGKTSTLNITQPEEVEFYQSTTINCSFTVQQSSEILRTEVYWITGDAREDYVYHPDMDYIHPDYKGKTKLVDSANLYLKDFHGPNNTVFYCRVIARKCLGPGPKLNAIVLEVTLIPKSELFPIVALVLPSVFVVLVIFIALAIYFSRKRGYENPTIVRKQQASEDLVYAVVNHSSSSVRKDTKGQPGSHPDPNTQIIYADVRKS